MSIRLAALAALAFSASALADDVPQDPRHFMFGASFGSMKHTEPGFSKSTTGWNAMLGYRFNQNISLEAGYAKSNSISGNIGGVAYSARAEGIFGTLVGAYWVTPSFSPYVRLGAINQKGRLRASIPGATVTASDSSTELLWGAGVQTIIEGALLRLEYARVDPEDAKNQFVTLGIVWLF